MVSALVSNWREQISTHPQHVDRSIWVRYAVCALQRRHAWKLKTGSCAWVTS